MIFKCGLDELDGSVFCAGLDAVLPTYSTHPDLRALVPPVMCLIRHANFWPRSAATHLDAGSTGLRPGAPSLDIQPLAELVDMCHNRLASNPLDKVYALLGMSTDAPLATDYEAAWDQVFRKLVHHCLSRDAQVQVWGDTEPLAVIREKGAVIGRIFSVETGSSSARGDVWNVGVHWKNKHGGFDTGPGDGSILPLQASVKPIQVGDAVCRLRWVQNPIIIRIFSNYAAVIKIRANMDGTKGEWSRRKQQITEYPIDFDLVWDWEATSYKQEHGSIYESFIEHHVGNKIGRTLNLGLILNALERYEDSFKAIKSTLQMHVTDHEYRDASLRIVYSSEGKGKSLDALARLRLGVTRQGVSSEMKHWDGWTPLWWALEQEDMAMTKLLLDTGANTEVKDSNGRTPLWWAAVRGDQYLVSSLLARGANTKVRDKNGWTPLRWASIRGHEVVVNLLGEIGLNDH